MDFGLNINGKPSFFMASHTNAEGTASGKRMWNRNNLHKRD